MRLRRWCGPSAKLCHFKKMVKKARHRQRSGGEIVKPLVPRSVGGQGAAALSVPSPAGVAYNTRYRQDPMLLQRTPRTERTLSGPGSAIDPLNHMAIPTAEKLIEELRSHQLLSP